MIDIVRPNVFASHALKNLQHANWHVREGVMTLLVRCLLVQSQREEGSLEDGVVTLATNAALIEELCFLVKIEDKKLLN